ncbi:MAG: bifunctional DNA-formamidopyrimidine glycosylase/DNA-(apurinic or apyrimidinic site) lyase [Planctomycetota bacterium]|jgi:formamidopyrimidine-DNA glycosylase
MPELPEVEHLRRSLDPWVVGCRFGKVSVRRRSVVSLASDELRGDLDAALLANSTIVETHRHGKQMALEALNGRVLVIQLGMTGSVTIERGSYPRGMDARHRHVVWEFSPSPLTARRAGIEVDKPWRLVFRDPRRFGGLTAYSSYAALKEAWLTLGHDAANPSGSLLRIMMEKSKRPIKSALLDQAMIAGLGNIYADESLFGARIHPLRLCNSLTGKEFHRLTAHIRRIINSAIQAGGSTLRDYRDAFGQPGDAVQSHQVYGRAGLPCLRCGTILEGFQLGGRTTVACPRCQDLSTNSAKPLA